MKTEEELDILYKMSEGLKEDMCLFSAIFLELRTEEQHQVFNYLVDKDIEMGVGTTRDEFVSIEEYITETLPRVLKRGKDL